jgi:hypothetical protein
LSKGWEQGEGLALPLYYFTPISLFKTTLYLKIDKYPFPLFAPKGGTYPNGLNSM